MQGTEVPGHHQEQLTQTSTVCALKRNVKNTRFNISTNLGGISFLLRLTEAFPHDSTGIDGRNQDNHRYEKRHPTNLHCGLFHRLWFKGQTKPMSNVKRQNH